MTRRRRTWRLTDRGWTVLTVALCVASVVLTWTCVPLTPWA